MSDKNVEILKFCEFLKSHPDKVKDIGRLKDVDELIHFAKENGFDFSVEDFNNYNADSNELSEEELLKISGGVLNKKISKDLLVFMMGLGLPFSMVTNVGALPFVHYNNGVSSSSVIAQKEYDIKSYLKEERISLAQEKAINMIRKIAGPLIYNKNKLFLSGKWDEINGYRCYSGSKLTEVEKRLDEAVKKGDLPIEAFKIEDINREAEKIKDDTGDLKTTFVVRGGIDALNLSKSCAEDGSIVQVASQFNALESPGAYFSPVDNWPLDRTQGPRASLQSIAAAKHRESAHLQNKLPDAIRELLMDCKLKNGQSILQKYPDLYGNGYLELFRISDVDDLTALRDFLKENIGGLKFLSQWVKCDDNGKKQLQVFSAAPSFQNIRMNWAKDERSKLLGEICKTIVVEQYRAIAKLAKIRASVTNKQTDVHLTLVGQGAFNNPEDTVNEIVKCLKQELEGTYNIKVFLHAYAGTEKWTKPLKDNGVEYSIK